MKEATAWLRKSPETKPTCRQRSGSRELLCCGHCARNGASNCAAKRQCSANSAAASTASFWLMQNGIFRLALQRLPITHFSFSEPALLLQQRAQIGLRHGILRPDLQRPLITHFGLRQTPKV